MIGLKKLKNRSELWRQMLSADFIGICLVSLIARIALQMRQTTVPLYANALDFSKSTAGMIATFYTLAGIVCRPLFGRLIDRTGIKRMLTLGLAFIALPMPFYTVLPTVGWMCALSVLCGIGFAILSTTLATMITDIFSDEYLSQGLGYFGLAATLSVAVGPSITLGILAALSYGGVFWGAAVVGALSLLCLLLISYEKKKGISKKHKQEETTALNVADSPSDSIKEENKGAWWTNFIEPTALSSSFVVGFATLCGATITTFLVLYADELGIVGIGAYFTVRAIGLAVSRLIVGKLTRIFGNARTLMASAIVMGLSYLGIFFSRSLTFLLIIAVFESLSCGVLQIVCNVSAVLKTQRAHYGRANATYYLFMDIGMGIGSLIWGIVADVTGSTGYIFLGSAFIMVVALLVVVFFKNHFELTEKRQESVDEEG